MEDRAWLVYIHDINHHKIDTYDVFRAMKEELIDAYKDADTFEEFEEIVRNEMKYRFWSRCEYELIFRVTNDSKIGFSYWLLPWVGSKNPEDEKFDLSESPILNGQEFAKWLEIEFPEPGFGTDKKIDIYNQVEFNWDMFIQEALFFVEDVLKDDSDEFYKDDCEDEDEDENKNDAPEYASAWPVSCGRLLDFEVRRISQYRYEIVKWVKDSCFVIAFLEWDDEEEYFDLRSVGMRYAQYSTSLFNKWLIKWTELEAITRATEDAIDE